MRNQRTALIDLLCRNGNNYIGPRLAKPKSSIGTKKGDKKRVTWHPVVPNGPAQHPFWKGYQNCPSRQTQHTLVHKFDTPLVADLLKNISREGDMALSSPKWASPTPILDWL